MNNKKIDTNEENELIELTKQLINIPSSVKYGNEIYEFVYEYLKKKGFDVKFQTIQNPYIEYSTYKNIYVTVGNGKGPKIMLNCHLDTVDAKEGWFHSPFSAIEEDGKIYGLGAADMKGGCASAIISLIAFTKQKSNINGELFLSCVFGEEAPFSLGADTLLREYNINNYDLIIVTEPSKLLAINDYCLIHKKIHKSEFPVVIVGAEGRILFEIEFFGKSAHASHPSQGVNALHDASRVISEIARFDLYSNIKMGRGHYCVLNFEGGDRTFTVPNYCKILVNRQFTLYENVKGIMNELKKIIKQLKLKSKVIIHRRYSPSPKLEYKPYLFESSKYIEIFMNNLPLPKKGKRCKFTSSSVGDFNHFGIRTKVPTIVFGPGGGNIHASNEFVNKNDIIKTTNYLLNFFMEVF